SVAVPDRFEASPQPVGLRPEPDAGQRIHLLGGLLELHDGHGALPRALEEARLQAGSRGPAAPRGILAGEPGEKRPGCEPAQPRPARFPDAEVLADLPGPVRAEQRLDGPVAREQRGCRIELAQAGPARRHVDLDREDVSAGPRPLDDGWQLLG